MKSGKILSIYDFFQHNFLCPIVDTVHGSNPGHLVCCFQFLSHALRYLHLLNNQGQTLLCLLVQIGKVSPELSFQNQIVKSHIGIYRLYLPNKQADVLYSSIPRNALRLRLEPPPSNVEAVWDNGDVLFFARYEELLNTSSGYAPETMGEDECIGMLELDEKLYSAQAHYINALTGDYREMPYGYVYLPMPRSKENIALNGEAWWLD